MHDVSIIGGVECYEQNGVAYLNLEAVAKGLGFTQEKNGVEYIRWETVNGFLASLGFPNKLGKDDFIPENIFYRLAMKAKNDTAEKFQAKVADEIIPSIRKTGSYSAINRESLSTNLQMFYMLADSNAALEMEQKRLEAAQKEQEKRLDVIEKRQDAIGEAVRPISSENWRKDVYKKFMRIQIASSIDHESLYTEIYTELDRRAGINLKARLRNMRERMRSEGAPTSKLKSLNYMDVIVLDKKLMVILEKILSEYEMKYCA